MNLNVDAILIDEIEFGNANDISRIYVAKINYKDLKSVCKLGNVSINREVDDTRAEKMVEYIRREDSFYPTIVVATNKKNLIDYDVNKKNITIKIKDEQDKFIVLDGQHRFESINLLLTDNYDINRFQSVFIIENMNNFQQRKVFLDINDTPKRVTTGTKLRFDKTIANYFSLSFLNLREEILNYIIMDDNQTSSNKKIPYKYLVKFNEKLIAILNKNFKNSKVTFNEVENFKEDVLKIDGMLFDIIEESQEKDYQITRYELFYIELGELMSEYVAQAIIENRSINLVNIQHDMIIIKNGIEQVSNKFLDNIPKSQSEKKEYIKALLYEKLGREQE